MVNDNGILEQKKTQISNELFELIAEQQTKKRVIKNRSQVMTARVITQKEKKMRNTPNEFL